MMYSIVTFPSPSNVIASTTDWASPLFTDLFPLAIVAVGVVGAVVLVKYGRKVLAGGIAKAFGGGRRRLGRRR